MGCFMWILVDMDITGSPDNLSITYMFLVFDLLVYNYFNDIIFKSHNK